MKLASLPGQGRDGVLHLVSQNLQQAVEVSDIAPTLQQALDNWQQSAPLLSERYRELMAGELAQAFPFVPEQALSPLPRAFQFVDGSAYLPHVERVRKARGAEMPPSFLEDPLMYQAVSDGFLAPNEDVLVASESYGIDFEAEVAVITDDVPMGVDAEKAVDHIQLVLLLNDVSLRNLIPPELAKGFGFVHSKPRSACSPVAVTPDELGAAWKDSKLHLPMLSRLNGELFGQPRCGEDMQFSFAQLISHAAKTRPLAAGTIVGSGTIANQDESLGASCLAEKRVLEIIRQGEAITPFMSFGDTIEIEINDPNGQNIFGTIRQQVKACT